MQFDIASLPNSEAGNTLLELVKRFNKSDSKDAEKNFVDGQLVSELNVEDGERLIVLNGPSTESDRVVNLFMDQNGEYRLGHPFKNCFTISRSVEFLENDVKSVNSDVKDDKTPLKKKRKSVGAKDEKSEKKKRKSLPSLDKDEKKTRRESDKKPKKERSTKMKSEKE